MGIAEVAVEALRLKQISGGIGSGSNLALDSGAAPEAAPAAIAMVLIAGLGGARSGLRTTKSTIPHQRREDRSQRQCLGLWALLKIEQL